MPSNQTPNYSLNQWERDDRILMEDFNADNVKIDTALTAEAKARAAADSTINTTLSAHSAALSRLGNCQIYTTSYVGNGKHGQEHSNTLSFPRKPLLVIIGGVEYGVLIAMIQGCQSISIWTLTTMSVSPHGRETLSPGIIPETRWPR